jgi:hypothetical protein
VLGIAAHGEADGVALRMLVDVLDGTPFVLDVRKGTVLTAEILEAVERGAYRAVCIADLPPSPPSKSRYLVKRLRTAVPDLPVMVGRWAPPALADESAEALLAAGAAHVGATLLESRDYLASLLPVLECARPSTDAA